MSISQDDRKAFALLSRSLERGFPVNPRDVLTDLPSARVGHIVREFAGHGLGRLARWGNADWLVPNDARMDMEEFNFVQSPRLLAALRFARESRIFTQKALFRAAADGGNVDAAARKLAARLWHLDLVAPRSASAGEKYFEITPKGIRLFAEAEAYSVPVFANRGDGDDLSKFHAVLDLEPVRNP